MQYISSVYRSISRLSYRGFQQKKLPARNASTTAENVQQEEFETALEGRYPGYLTPKQRYYMDEKELEKHNFWRAVIILLFRNIVFINIFSWIVFSIMILK